VAHRPEILAPAGDPASLETALAHGADSVYLGLDSGFNARARADNFSAAGLAETAARIHRAGARLYLTMNTLVFEPELEAVEDLIRVAATSGVDALIVQDPAVALIARELCPDLAVHASTQMTISSPEAARFAERLGATRVVLPRELSVDEIRAFTERTSIETEVFIHGALCVAWSGQCLTSEAWGQRSANRGQCAQSCRMPYDLVVDGAERDLGEVAYLLSPKDLAGLRAVPDLMALGVHGLKIEGRQKGPAYVGTAVAGYRRWVDALADGHPRSEAEAALEDDLRAMSVSYTRGFGDGFLAGSDHQTLVEGRFPKHRGIGIGRVIDVKGRRVRVTHDDGIRPWTGALALDQRPAAPEGTVDTPLTGLGGAADAASGPGLPGLTPRAGMGVVFDAGNPEDRDEPGGPLFSVEPTEDGYELAFGDPGPDLTKVSVGDRVWITSDPAVAQDVQRTTAGGAPERIPLDLTIRATDGEPVHVVASTGRHQEELTGTTPCAPARGGGLDSDLLTSKLGTLGGTPFHLRTLDASAVDAGLFVPVSELKALRRALVDALEQRVLRGPARTVGPRGALSRVRDGFANPSPAEDTSAALLPLCRTDAQLDAVIAAGIPAVELDWMEWVGLGAAVQRAHAAGLQVTVATLRVQKPGEESYDKRADALRPDGVLVRHWGGVMHFADRAGQPGPTVHGDFSLNVTNSVTARMLLDLGLASLTPSFDLDEAQLLAMLANVPADRMTIMLHHRIPTFHTEHCVFSHLLSNGRDYRTCGRPCEHHEVGLKDHLGRTHPVIVDAGCRNTVFNAEAQTTAPLVPRLLELGVRRFRVELVRESGDETRRLLDGYRELLDGAATPAQTTARLGIRSRTGVSSGPMELIV